MKSSMRKVSYLALGILNSVLQVCAAQNVFHQAPVVAGVVSVLSLFLASFMHAWDSADAPLAPALLEAAKDAAPAAAALAAPKVFSAPPISPVSTLVTNAVDSAVVDAGDSEMKKEFPKGGTP